MVGPAVFLASIDDEVEGWKSGFCRPPARFESSVVVESIHIGFFELVVLMIHPEDEFSPADDLADESFDGIQRDGCLVVEGPFDDLARGKETAVHHGGENRVEKDSFSVGDRVFIVSEKVEPFAQEIGQPDLGLLVGHWEPKVRCVAGMVREKMLNQVDDFLGHRVWGDAEHWGWLD